MLRWRSKVPGHYTDHRIRISPQLNRVAYRMWIAAKVVLPEMVAHHGKTRPAFHILPRRNDSAQCRLPAQRFEEPRIDLPDTDLHRFDCTCVVHFVDVDSAPLRECARLSLDIHHIRERIVFLDDNELLRILVGKRTEQYSIDHTEYRRVRADAESEGEDGDSREARGLPKRAEAEANVQEEL